MCAPPTPEPPDTPAGTGRQRFLGLAAAAAGTGLLGACGTGNSSPAPGPVVAPGTDGADVPPLDGIESPELTIGFIPITCASPLVNAAPLGIYAKHGLTVTLKKYAGWADLWGAYVAGEVQATHMLAPMPLALHHGFASGRKATRMPLITNVNGQAITLANRHRETVRGPADMRGFVLGIPFDYSMHNLLLRHYLSTGGLDPDLDVDLRILRPADMVANLLTGNIDGFLGPDPFNQLAVAKGAGYLFTLTRDLWDGHPCCCLGVSDEWAAANPVTYRAVTRAVADAAVWSDDPAHRVRAATSMATEQFLNQKPELLSSILTGRFPDGTGRTVDAPDRIGFRPFPREDFALWILTQLQRWDLTDGRDLGDAAALYASVAEVVDSPAAIRSLTDLGLDVPPRATGQASAGTPGPKDGDTDTATSDGRTGPGLLARLTGRGARSGPVDRDVARDRRLAVLILLVTTAVFIGLWNMATSGSEGGLAPTPAATLQSAIAILSDPFYREGINSVGVFWHLLASLQRVLTGFLLAAVVAIPLGFLLGSMRSARWGLDPIIQILRPVSPLAWLPLGLALLRDAKRTALFVIVMSALWPLLLNTIEGVRSVNPLHIQLARTVEAGRWRAIRSILLPSALPQMITGLRLSLSTSWLVIIAAEMLVGGRGMGYFVWNMWNKLDIPAIVVAILIIGLVGLALDRAVSALHKVVPNA